eukprot:CAMPEP_0177720784 /NCGR_PEP_ID=MMETSP0484_2-20121128/16801_1 /TAXON_ID=354590 /ORGANISM="Rhodomonas lens, Strain RHODO" /LENGTH=74 /DNA_ID=CAMNT_0019233051 /DNA_START=164 /DNA_END=385 /DNA_ORIENTATION=-
MSLKHSTICSALLLTVFQIVGARLELSMGAGRGVAAPLRLRGGMPVFFSQGFGGGGFPGGAQFFQGGGFPGGFE